MSVTFYCFNGGFGWGETGSEVTVVFLGCSEYDTHVFLRYAPGGWRIKHMEKYIETP